MSLLATQRLATTAPPVVVHSHCAAPAVLRGLRTESLRRMSLDAENRRAAPPRVGGCFFLKVSPGLPKALQLFCLRSADGCSMCRCAVIANTVDRTRRWWEPLDKNNSR